jgi:hypothetical protein
LKNFSPEEDFASHGLGIFEDPENEKKLYLFFVNHRRSGSCFEIFEHTLDTNELIHLETIQHELIYTPNDVVPVSKHEFYFTNDHYFTNPTYKQFERELFLLYKSHIFIILFFFKKNNYLSILFFLYYYYKLFYLSHGQM